MSLPSLSGAPGNPPFVVSANPVKDHATHYVTMIAGKRTTLTLIDNKTHQLLALRKDEWESLARTFETNCQLPSDFTSYDYNIETGDLKIDGSTSTTQKVSRIAGREFQIIQETYHRCKPLPNTETYQSSIEDYFVDQRASAYPYSSAERPERPTPTYNPPGRRDRAAEVFTIKRVLEEFGNTRGTLDARSVLFGFRYLQTMHEDYGFTLVTTNTDSIFTEASLNSESIKDPQPPLPNLPDPSNPPQNGLYVIPIHINRNHFVLMTLDFTDGKATVSYYNPLGAHGIPQEVKDLQESLRTRYAATLDLNETSDQKDGNNCGFHIIHLLDRKLQDDRPFSELFKDPERGFNVVQARTTFAQALRTLPQTIINPPHKVSDKRLAPEEIGLSDLPEKDDEPVEVTTQLEICYQDPLEILERKEEEEKEEAPLPCLITFSSSQTDLIARTSLNNDCFPIAIDTLQYIEDASIQRRSLRHAYQSINPPPKVQFCTITDTYPNPLAPDDELKKHIYNQLATAHAKGHQDIIIQPPQNLSPQQATNIAFLYSEMIQTYFPKQFTSITYAWQNPLLLESTTPEADQPGFTFRTIHDAFQDFPKIAFYNQAGDLLLANGTPIPK